MYPAYSTYEFFLKMFNKRNEMTPKQDKKVKAILLNNIKPFVLKRLEGKFIKN